MTTPNKAPERPEEWWEKDFYWKCLYETFARKDKKRAKEIVSTIVAKSRVRALKEVDEIIQKFMSEKPLIPQRAVGRNEALSILLSRLHSLIQEK